MNDKKRVLANLIDQILPLNCEVSLDDVVESLLKNDVVKVVRCEDCGYYHRGEKFSFCDRPCEEPVQRFPDDFCSRGVRKND